MAKIPRVYQRLFGSTATAGQVKRFGSLAAGSPFTSTDAADIQSLSQWLDGWFASVMGGNSPAIEDMNAIFFVIAQQLGYLMQAGVAEWDATTIYYIGSLVNSAGAVYVSLTDTNTNNAVTDATKWKRRTTKVVSKNNGSSPYTAVVNDVVLFDASGGACTCTLPTAANSTDERVTVKKTDSSANLVTVSGTIDGVSNYVIADQNESETFVSDGSGWYRI